MPSNKKACRESQKGRDEQAIARRIALLKEQGATAERIQKDPHLRHLKADLRRTHTRLRSIAALEKQAESLALRKVQRAQEALEEKQSGGKRKPAEPEPPKKAKKTKQKAAG